MDIKKVLLDSVDIEKLVNGLLVEGLEPAFKKVVASSDNLVDDAIFQMVYPPLTLALQRFIAAEVAKLKA